MAATSLMQSALWQTAGWVMLHFLWVGGAIGLFAAVGRLLLPNNPARRYAFALGCFAALFVAPGFIIVCLRLDGPPTSSSSRQMAVPLVAAEGDLAPPVHWLNKFEAAPAAPTTLSLEPAVCFLPWLWLIGAPGTFLLVMTGLIGSERLRQQSQRLDRGDLADRCRRLAEALHIRGPIALGLCTRLASPILVGIFKPMILLPPAALSGWSVEQLEMVLLHELAHVRRWDNLVNLLQRLVEAILFFHPVVWWLSAWIRLEREMCCDQVVVRHTGKARAYAETLAALVAWEPIVRTGALAMVENGLVTRIRRILNLEDRSMKVPVKMFGFGAALPVAALVAIGLYAQNDAPKRVAEGKLADEKAATPARLADDDQKADKLPPGNALVGKVVPQDALDRPKDDAKKPQLLSQRAVVEAYQQVQLRSRVAGVVKEVAVDLGSRVKRGQWLVQLEVPEAELELRLKTALVQQAKAEANRAKSTVRAAQATFQSTKALAQEAEAVSNGATANLKIRKDQFDRITTLFRSSAVSQSEHDEARVQFAAAQAAQNASDAKWQAAKAMIEENMAKVVQAEAGVQVAEAHLAVADVGLQRAQSLLQSAQIVAPFDGVVTSRSVDIGAFVQAAGQGNAIALMTIARTDVVRIVAQVPEAQIAKFDVGAAATVQIDAYLGKQFEGKVARLAPALDPNTRTLRVEIDLRNDGRLLPGMTGTVTLKAGQ